jgi:Domain of unknown function (DUF4440)
MALNERLTKEADMANNAIERELLVLEKRYWQAIKDKDIATMNSLTDYPCIVTGAQGIVSIDGQQMSSMISKAPWELREFELKDDVAVRRISDDVAIFAYKVREELMVEGKPVALDAADASVWVRRDGRWLCALHTESLLGDPYGRDRKAIQ